jgi:hypothetical protein
MIYPIGIFLLFFFFNTLGIPGAGCQSLLESLLFQDPVIHEVKIKALSHEKLPKH